MLVDAGAVPRRRREPRRQSDALRDPLPRCEEVAGDLLRVALVQLRSAFAIRASRAVAGGPELSRAMSSASASPLLDGTSPRGVAPWTTMATAKSESFAGGELDVSGWPVVRRQVVRDPAEAGRGPEIDDERPCSGPAMQRVPIHGRVRGPGPLHQVVDLAAGDLEGRRADRPARRRQLAESRRGRTRLADGTSEDVPRPVVQRPPRSPRTAPCRSRQRGRRGVAGGCRSWRRPAATGPAGTRSNRSRPRSRPAVGAGSAAVTVAKAFRTSVSCSVPARPRGSSPTVHSSSSNSAAILRFWSSVSNRTCR